MQQLGRVKCAVGEDHFAAGFDFLDSSARAAGYVPDADRPTFVEKHRSGLRVRPAIAEEIERLKDE
jgi:hypothetical protein